MPNYIRPVCSNKPRPRMQRGAKGHAGWNRDVYHAAKSGMATYCGLDSSEWLRMDEMPIASARADDNFCKRCERKVSKQKQD